MLLIFHQNYFCIGVMRVRKTGHLGENKILIKIILIMAGMIAIIIILDSYIRPPIESMAEHSAKVFATKTINSAMAEEMEKHSVLYGDIIRLTQNNSGDITSVQTDMQKVNLLKTKVTENVVRELGKEEKQTLKIPVGTLIGSQITASRGPDIEIKLIPIGYVQTGLYNNFISAGINQTLHQIMLEVTVQTLVIAPGYRIRTETVTNYCVAETVIVGKIPDAYTDIHGDNSPIVAKVNDYGAQA